MSEISTTWPSGAVWSLETMNPSERADGEPVTPAWAELDDRQLVRAAVGGAREAFDELVVRHRRAVYQLCYRFVANHDDAAELSQEVFLRAFRALASFKGEAAVGTWLHRIGVNVCLNRLALKVPPRQEIESAEALPDRRDGPELELLTAERASRVRRAVARLPERQRATLILRVFHDLPHREIARILGSSVGAVKANFFHALRNMKKLLDEHEQRGLR